MSTYTIIYVLIALLVIVVTCIALVFFKLLNEQTQSLKLKRDTKKEIELESV